jgi:hypothetical protein
MFIIQGFDWRIKPGGKPQHDLNWQPVAAIL